MAWFIKVTNQSFRPLPGTYISQSYLLSEHIIPFRFPSPTGDLYFSIILCNNEKIEKHASFRPLPGTYISQLCLNVKCAICNLFPSPTGDLYFSIPSPQFLVNTDCITQFAWEMIFQKYKFIFHYKKLSKCLFYAVRGKTNIF